MAPKISIESGLVELRVCQKEYNKKIENAPVKSSKNQLSGGWTTNKYELRMDKMKAMKSIVMDYAIFGIELMSAEALEKLQPKKESITEIAQRELGE